MRNLETSAIGVHGLPEIVLTSINHYETDSDESEIGMPALLIRGDGDSSVESNLVYSMYNETSDDESKVTMPSLAERDDDESSIKSNESNVENNQLKPLPLVCPSAQSDGESGVYPS